MENLLVLKMVQHAQLKHPGFAINFTKVQLLILVPPTIFCVQFSRKDNFKTPIEQLFWTEQF